MTDSKIIISIGRSFGSRGAEVGRLLAEKLDIPFYDKEILDEQVKNSGYTNEYLKNFDEKKTNSFLYSVYMNPQTLMLQSAFGGTQPMDLAIQKVQFEAIKEIAAKGSCVIVGRRADQILKNERGLVRVFISAEDEDRVAHVAQRDNLSRKEAETKVKRMDRSRKAYYNYYGDGEWGQASNYDICLNTSTLGVEGCVEVILALIKTHF
jgi:cytidylate kinase